MNFRLMGYALTGLVFYFLFLVATLPAHWLGAEIERRTNGTLTLSSAKGTVWLGSGILEVRGSSQSVSTRAQWKLHWLPLFSGQLGAAVETRGDLNLQSDVRLGLHSLALHNLEMELPATHLPAFYSPALFISPTGTLSGKAQEFSIHAGQVSGEAQIRWTQAGSKVGAYNDLGDYLLVLNGENSFAKIRIDTLRGDLKVNASGQWQTGRDGELTLQGNLHTGARDTALKPLTTLLRARREGEQYQLSTSIRIALPPWIAARK